MPLILGTRRFRLCLAVALVALAALLPAPAGAARPSRAAAARALAKVQQLQRGHGVRTGRELTPALTRLFASLPSLAPDDRRAAEAILTRPDDLQADPDGTHKWTGSEASSSPACTVHFCVHFTTQGGDASTLGYAKSMANLFENEVYACENGSAAAACAGSPGLGWRDPAPDGSLGDTGGKPAAGARCTSPSCVDVYIQDLYPDAIFGYTAVDPDQSQDPSVPHFGYMVMDKDYSRFATPSMTGAQAEQVTAAHEYNHLLQDAYDYLQDPWMLEATAVYMEDKVYPAVNDYLDYVNAWVANTRQPLTAFPDTNLKAYGSAVWNHWLDHRFGAGIVRDAWARSVAAANFAPDAYGAAISAAGGAGFSDEFARFAAAVAEWEAPGAGFPDSYPDVPRDGSLPTGSQSQPFSLPHTTFALFDVPIPADLPPRIRLVATLPAGTAGAVALVGRTGGDPAAGTVTSQLTPMPNGGAGAVQLDNPAQFGRITAVVVNADVSKSGFDATAGDYVFTRDASDVVATMVGPGPPVPSTGAATSIRDHSAVVGAAVDPQLLDTTWQVEYGPTARYGAATAAQAIPGSTVGAASVTVPVGGLRANATYHYRVIAQNASGATTGEDMTFKTARDVTKPRLTVKVPRQRSIGVRERGVLIEASCSERCFGSVRVELRAAAVRRLGLPRLLAKGRVKLEGRSSLKKLRVRLTPAAARGWRLQRKAFRANVHVIVRDQARNRTVATRTLVLLQG